jgi:hypothetical protein
MPKMQFGYQNDIFLHLNQTNKMKLIKFDFYIILKFWKIPKTEQFIGVTSLKILPWFWHEFPQF